MFEDLIVLVGQGFCMLTWMFLFPVNFCCHPGVLRYSEGMLKLVIWIFLRLNLEVYHTSEIVPFSIDAFLKFELFRMPLCAYWNLELLVMFLCIVYE